MKSLLYFGIVNVMVYQTYGQNLRKVTPTGTSHEKIISCHIVDRYPYAGGYKDVDSWPFDPVLCNHMVTPYIEFSKETNILYKSAYWLSVYKKLQDLKTKYPHIKSFLSVYASYNVEFVTKTYESRSRVIRDILNTLRKYNFDGLELSWYNPKDQQTDGEESNFIELIKMLKKSFVTNGYILSVQMDTFYIGLEQYDMEEIIPIADFVSVNFFYYRSFSNVSDAKAPLRGIDDQDERSVENIIKFILNQGVSKDKLLLGIPLYGHNFYNVNIDDDGIVFGDTRGYSASRLGPISVNGSFHMSYFEICSIKSNKSYNLQDQWHDKTSTPYTVEGYHITFYENTRSAAAKVKMGIDYGLRGFTLWHMGSDDYEGTCDPEEETYEDFTERLKKMNIDRVLIRKTLARLDLPDKRDIDKNSFVGYYVDNKRLGLQLPVIKQDKYSMLRAVNNAVVIASQEEIIIDEMEKILQEEAFEDK